MKGVLALVLAELLTKQNKQGLIVNHSILSHGAQLSYMLGAADMISCRLPDLRFHSSYSSKRTVAFLSRNVVSHPYPSILHTLTPISDFSGEQCETNLQLLHQLELGSFPISK